MSSGGIQQLLDENAALIKVIVRCQREGRIMDAMLYQTRLQLNIMQLAAIADNQPSPSSGPQALRQLVNSTEQPASSQILLTRFVRAVKENGLKNITQIANITDIAPDKIVPLANAYIDFLKRQNRFSEATQLENELAINGVERA